MLSLIGVITGALMSYLVPKILDPLVKSKRSSLDQHRFPILWWVLAHAVAGGVGGTLSGALGIQGLRTPGGFANWAAYGACLGIAQWLVLQRERQITPWWAVASSAGWAVAGVFEAVNAPPLLGWAFAGLVIGALQWPILAKRRARAFWWVPANVVASVLGLLMGYAIGLAMIGSGMSLGSSWVVGWSLVGLFGSCVTAFAFTHMPPKLSVSLGRQAPRRKTFSSPVSSRR